MIEQEWEELTPSRVSNRFMPTVTIRVAPSGNQSAAQTYIGLNHHLVTKLGWKIDKSSLVNIHRGKGENANSIRMQMAANGKFRIQTSGNVKNGVYGGRVSLHIPGQPTLPMKQVEAVHRVVDGVLIIELPADWDWGTAAAVEEKPAPIDKRSAHEKLAEKMLKDAVASPPEPIEKKVETAKPVVPVIPDLKDVEDHEARKPTLRGVELNDPKEIAKAELQRQNESPYIGATSPQPYVPRPDGIKIMGRFVSAPGMSPFNLMSDELGLFKALLERFGELMPNGGLRRVEDAHPSILSRLHKRLKGSKLMLVQKPAGWLLTWSNDPRYSLEDKG